MNNIATNAHEYSVSELAFSLKRKIEDTFGRVRVRGELGRVVIAKSGHMYVDVKDDKAVIASIMWKGAVSRLSVRPEEGMEVVVEGKLTTYPGRSQYQLVIDRLEPAGVGALMALLEKRKKMLTAEGLFSDEHKQELPYLPKTIGVITSPTGAVIRDILHRVEDRFPMRVLVWPVLVQGDKAAAQISAAITGFNNYQETDALPRPDVIIVARGGGSIEDLWCFNEENVVRAAFASGIPIISAVGHETDWTLLDYVADHRAPTPTAAAEIAVPARAELMDTTADLGLRLKRGLSRNVEGKKLGFTATKLPKLDAVLSNPRQRFDLAAARLRPDALAQDITRKQDRVDNTGREAFLTMSRLLQKTGDRLAGAGKLLGAYSYQGVLARGYALVTDRFGKIVRTGKPLKSGQSVDLTFADGKRVAVIDGKPTPKRRPKKSAQNIEKTQGDLF